METTLHRQLKERYATEGAVLEQRLGRFRIDVVQRNQLVEIQLAPLAAIRDKIAELHSQEARLLSERSGGPKETAAG